MAGAEGSPRRLPALRARGTAVVVWALLALLGLSGGLEFAASHGPLGSAQRDVDAYLQQSETRALEAFAVARTINAAVSFLKSADLSAVVAQVAPLQVLEPVDDLAKQFSDVMVVSIVAIQMQRIFLRVSQAWALAVLLPIGCAALALAACVRDLPMLRGRLAALGRSVIVLALCARFVVLAAGLVGHGVTERFLASDLDSTMRGIAASGGGLDRVTRSAVAAPSPASPPPATGPAGGPTTSMLDRIEAGARQALGRGEAMVNSAQGWVPDRATINAFVVDLPAQIVTAIAIFLVQTILTPVCVTLVLSLLLRQIVRPASAV